MNFMASMMPYTKQQAMEADVDDYYIAIGGPAHGKCLPHRKEYKRLRVPVHNNDPVYGIVPAPDTLVTYHFIEYELREFEFKGRRMRYYILADLTPGQAIMAIDLYEDDDHSTDVYHR